MTRKALLAHAGNTLARLWIYGGTLFFFGRFSAVFYQENRAAIDAVLASLRARLGH